MVDPDLHHALQTHLFTTEQRFDKLENKIDNLSEVIVSLARAETKLVALEESRREQGKRIGIIEAEIRQLEDSTEKNSGFRNFIVKGFWVITTALSTVAVGYYFAG